MKPPIAVLVVVGLLLAGGVPSGAVRAGGKGAQQAPREPGSYVLRIEDSTVLRLGGPDSTAVLSPDGTMAAVATRSGPEPGVRVVEFATGRVSVPLMSAAGQVDTPVWSPDGAFLAFRFARFGPPDPAAAPPSGLYIVAPRTYEAINTLPDSLTSWTWTPDGRAITGITFELADERPQWSIVSVDVATGAVGQTVLEPTASLCPTAPAWSADGRWLAFASGSFQQACGEPGTAGLWLWDAAGGEFRQLTRGAIYYPPMWTSDGRLLARRLGGRDPANPQGPPLPDPIVLVALDGSERVVGTTLSRTFPFMPYEETAGRTVTFGLAGCDEGAVFAADLAGGSPRRLSDPAVAAASPKLAPDGRSVAWVAFRPDESDLQLAATDGSVVRTVLVGAPGLELTGWSGDGRLLSFTIGMPALQPCPG